MNVYETRLLPLLREAMERGASELYLHAGMTPGIYIEDGIDFLADSEPWTVPDLEMLMTEFGLEPSCTEWHGYLGPVTRIDVRQYNGEPTFGFRSIGEVPFVLAGNTGDLANLFARKPRQPKAPKDQELTSAQLLAVLDAINEDGTDRAAVIRDGQLHFAYCTSPDGE